MVDTFEKNLPMKVRAIERYSFNVMPVESMFRSSHRGWTGAHSFEIKVWHLEQEVIRLELY